MEIDYSMKSDIITVYLIHIRFIFPSLRMDLSFPKFLKLKSWNISFNVPSMIVMIRLFKRIHKHLFSDDDIRISFIFLYTLSISSYGSGSINSILLLLIFLFIIFYPINFNSL